MNPEIGSPDVPDDANDCCEDRDAEGDDGEDNECCDDGEADSRSTHRQETVTEFPVTSSSLTTGGFGGSVRPPAPRPRQSRHQKDKKMSWGRIYSTETWEEGERHTDKNMNINARLGSSETLVWMGMMIRGIRNRGA